jgi:hypothetical protein
MEKPNPYEPGKCWYGLKLPRKHTVMPCGLDAREYHVYRSDLLENYRRMGNTYMKVLVCLNHKGVMERDGYTLTLVTPDNA